MRTVQADQLKTNVLQALISGFITGLFIYLIETHWISLFLGFMVGGQVYTYLVLYETYIKPWFSRKNVFLSLIISTVLYIAIIIFSVFLSILIFNGFNFSPIVAGYRQIILSDTMLYGLIFGFVLSFFFSSYSMFDTLLGKNFLIKVFLGRYNRPFEEERIFMFLDLKSSTTIAEKLGHKKFLSLLNDFFRDLAEPVVATRGEIHKYVGDEAIISWKMKYGDGTTNPINCFFSFRDRIVENEKRYLKKYDLVPRFKAAIHGGTVVTGEMGFVKKEIAYLGDVLNTTSRIESACHEFNKDLIVSGEMIKRMKPGKSFIVEPLGKIRFRGKEIPVSIFAVDRKQNANQIQKPE